MSLLALLAGLWPGIAAAPPPAAPSGLVAAAASATQIALTWTDNSNDETGFAVERMRQLDGAWTPAATLAAGATAWMDGGLTGGTRYDYRVRSFNASGASAPVRAFAATHTARIPLPAGFAIGMPIVESEIGSAHFRMLPFGVHQFTSPTASGNHVYDGHPGWDIEYAAGGSVRAAAAGTVQSVTQQGSEWTVQVQHQQAPVFRRTIYNGLSAVAAGIAAGSAVIRGQVLGAPHATTQVILGTPVTSWTFHFQLDDYGAPATVTGANDQAVDPFPYLDGSGRAVFGRVWQQATWREEIVEPYPGQPRILNPFPIVRTWALKTGTHAARIEFRHPDPALAPTPGYAIFDDNGVQTESGAVQLWATPGYVTLDLQPALPSGQPSGPPRLARYDITGGALRIDYGAPGSARPADLRAASTYVSP